MGGRAWSERHGFGLGEYKYFRYPLPSLLSEVRTAVYPHLVPVASRWNAAMGIDVRYPEKHAQFVERCQQAGQTRPTPLLLQYGAGDYNCLHQDLYGEHVFPLQLAILLSDPGADFTGGEFVMTEHRPRMQSRPIVVALRQGDGAVFAVHNRPVRGARNTYRVNLRRGVSRVRSGLVIPLESYSTMLYKIANRRPTPPVTRSARRTTCQRLGKADLELEALQGFGESGAKAL